MSAPWDAALHPRPDTATEVARSGQRAGEPRLEDVNDSGALIRLRASGFGGVGALPSLLNPAGVGRGSNAQAATAIRVRQSR